MEKQTTYQPDLLAPTMTPPDPLTAVWHAIAPAFTPETVMGVIMTIAITHALKVIAAVAIPSVAGTLPKWRAFCTTLSVAVGALVGLAIWLAGGPIATLFACAFLTGPVWRLTLSLAPVRVSDALLTDTDRGFK